jgi:cytochrome c
VKPILPLLAGIGVLASGLALAPQAASGAPGGPGGEAIFRQRCAACHMTPAGRPAVLGPSLAGVVGRKAASTGFAYTTQLKQSGLTWNRENLDRFLTSPMRTVPGTRMVVPLPNDAERAAVIAYLATLR